MKTIQQIISEINAGREVTLSNKYTKFGFWVYTISSVFLLSYLGFFMFKRLENELLGLFPIIVFSIIVLMNLAQTLFARELKIRKDTLYIHHLLRGETEEVKLSDLIKVKKFALGQFRYTILIYSKMGIKKYGLVYNMFSMIWGKEEFAADVIHVLKGRVQ